LQFLLRIRGIGRVAPLIGERLLPYVSRIGDRDGLAHRDGRDFELLRLVFQVCRLAMREPRAIRIRRLAGRLRRRRRGSGLLLRGGVVVRPAPQPGPVRIYWR
jgi:hypothetical protein